MPPLTEAVKLVAKMRRSYNAARREIKKAQKECTPGTQVYLQHIKALADLNAAEREEEIKLGISPSNLSTGVKTEFLFVSHVATIPTSREELQKLLGARLKKECEGLYLEDEDEAIREDFEKQYGASK